MRPFKVTLTMFVATVLLGGWSCQPVKTITAQQVHDEVTDALSIPHGKQVYTGAYAPPLFTIFCNQVLDTNAPTLPQSCLLSDPNDWFASTVSDSDKKAILDGIMKPIPGGGAFKITSKLSSDVNVNATFPLIGKIFTASGNVDVGKDSTVTMTGDSFSEEVIKWKPFWDAAKANKFTDSTQRLLISPDYVMVAAQWVVSNLSVTLEVDPKVDVSANGTLPTAIGKLGGNTTAGVKVTRTGNRTFNVTADKFVVASLIDRPDRTTLQGEGPETSEGLKGQAVSAAAVAQLIDRLK